jgi:hypothetical protein
MTESEKPIRAVFRIVMNFPLAIFPDQHGAAFDIPVS